MSRDDADDIETVPALRAKTQNLQIKILEQVRELERSERMLQAQSSINRDINTELEALQKRFNGKYKSDAVSNVVYRHSDFY